MMILCVALAAEGILLEVECVNLLKIICEICDSVGDTRKVALRQSLQYLTEMMHQPLKSRETLVALENELHPY